MRKYTVLKEICFYFRSDFSQKKQVLESSLDDMKKQLRVVQKKLDIEYRWKNTSDGLHQKILLEKSELIAK